MAAVVVSIRDSKYARKWEKKSTYVGNVDLSASSTAAGRATEAGSSRAASKARVEVTAAVGSTSRAAISTAVATGRSNKSRFGLAVLRAISERVI